MNLTEGPIGWIWGMAGGMSPAALLAEGFNEFRNLLEMGGFSAFPAVVAA